MKMKKFQKSIKDFSELALWKLIKRKYVKKFVKENNIEHFFLVMVKDLLEQLVQLDMNLQIILLNY